MSQVISMITNQTSVKFYALALGAALAFTPVQALANNNDNDLDGDSVHDKMDNCIGAHNLRVNGVQPDTDGDGYGNRCDCDYDNDLMVDFEDLFIFATFADAVDTDRHRDESSEIDWDYTIEIEDDEGNVVATVTPEDADHNADGRVDRDDLDILRAAFGKEPGPSNDL